MKRLLFLTLFLLLPLVSFATEGACSYHGGANCGIGAINNQAVCNDGWLSSVPYNLMEECIGYNSSCTSYLDQAQFISTKTAIKNDLGTLKAEIDKLKADFYSLDNQELQAILDYQQSLVGRGVTTGGAQPIINGIHREYELKKLVVSQQYDSAVNRYDDLVQRFNGICQGKGNCANLSGLCS